MERVEPVKADLELQLVDDLRQRLTLPHLEARGKEVATVEADSDPLVPASKLDQPGEL